MLLDLLEQIARATACPGDDGDDDPIDVTEHDGADGGRLPEASLLVGPTPEELESLNELIRFDHVYYKTPPRIQPLSPLSTAQNSSILPETLPTFNYLQDNTALAPIEVQSVSDPLQYNSLISEAKLNDAKSIIDIESSLIDFDNLLTTLADVDNVAESLDNESVRELLCESQDDGSTSVDDRSDISLPLSPQDLCDGWLDDLDTPFAAIVNNNRSSVSDLSDQSSQFSDDSLAGSETLCDSWSDLFPSIV